MKWLSDLAIAAMMMAGFVVLCALVYLIDRDTFPPKNHDDHRD
jgi:hypothetical protein